MHLTVLAMGSSRLKDLLKLRNDLLEAHEDPLKESLKTHLIKALEDILFTLRTYLSHL